jgi:hypothetical protein
MDCTYVYSFSVSLSRQFAPSVPAHRCSLPCTPKWFFLLFIVQDETALKRGPARRSTDGIVALIRDEGKRQAQIPDHRLQEERGTSPHFPNSFIIPSQVCGILKPDGRKASGTWRCDDAEDSTDIR